MNTILEDSCIEFRCDGCSKSGVLPPAVASNSDSTIKDLITRLDSSLQQFTTAVSQITRRLDTIEKTCDDLKDRVSAIEDRGESAAGFTTVARRRSKPSPAAEVDNSIRQARMAEQEQVERAEKKANFVAYGVAESVPPIPAEVDRYDPDKNEDLRNLRAWAFQIGSVDPSDIVGCFRMGKISTKIPIRCLKVLCKKNSDIKDEVHKPLATFSLQKKLPYGPKQKF